MRGKPALCGGLLRHSCSVLPPLENCDHRFVPQGLVKHRMSEVRAWSRPITASAFLASQDKEAFDRVPLVLEQNNALFAASADPTPTADERSAAEEVRLDRCSWSRQFAGHTGARQPYPLHFSCNALELGPAKFCHPIKNTDANLCFSLLIVKMSRFEFGPDHSLPSTHLGLNATALV